MSRREGRVGGSAPTDGVVFLVGAGPGDPDLITVRGAAVLARAEVVLYDELVAFELLDLAPADAERVAVGKRGHDAPTLGQDEINTLLIEYAQQGKRVVRLKGGDPLVFGRGAEEALACRAGGIRFEFVPGVTSAVGVLSYAGIPLTDRHHSASFAVVTGHKDPTRVSEETRWAELGRSVDTLVILMGMRNLADLVAKIIEGGKAPETPSAVVMDGTLAGQRIVTATLRELPARVAEAGLGAPAVVVIGDVVDLRPELRWRAATPLHGRRVLVTRAHRQGVELAHEIRLCGGEPIYFPMIELLAAEDSGPLDRAIENLASYDVVVLSSSNAVRFFVDCARRLGALEPLMSGATRIACVGPKTAATVVGAGLPVSLVAPGKGDAQALLDELSAVFSPVNRSFLLPRSEIGRKVLPEGLRAAGARVDEVVAYRNLRPQIDVEGLCAELMRTPRPVLTFTSPSTVRNFVAVVDAEARAAMDDCIVAAMGDATASALRDVGLQATVVPSHPGARNLVAAIVDYVRSSEFESSDEGEV